MRPSQGALSSLPAGHQAAAEPLLPAQRLGNTGVLCVPGLQQTSEHPAKRLCCLIGTAEEVSLLQPFFLKIVNCCMQFSAKQKNQGVYIKRETRRERVHKAVADKNRKQQICLELSLLKVEVMFALILKTKVEVE